MNISIIIPIYKVEKYIHDCVDSVLSQTFQNIEVILVDDGSPDSCPGICDEYKKKDNRVRVIHKLNGGLSDARNEGLQSATGDYIIFLDSDDYYHNMEFVSEVAAFLESRDVDILCHQRQSFVDGQNNNLSQPSYYSEKELTEESYSGLVKLLSDSGKLDASASLKVIKRDFLFKNDLFFTKGMYSEDVDWFMRVLLFAKSVAVINCVAYCYRLRNTSISHNVKLKNIQDLFFSVEHYSDIYKSIDDKILADAVLNYLAYQYFISLGYASNNLCGEEKKRMLEKMYSYKWLSMYASDYKTKKCSRLINVLGFRLTAFILGFYLKIK